MSQLQAVLKRMKNNPELNTGYQAAMDSFELKGYARQVNIDYCGPHALLSHHPVEQKDE